MVALSVDIKEYIHIVGQRVLRGVHVGVAEARVVRAGMLLVEHRRVMAHPAGLVRAYFHDGEASLSFFTLLISLSLLVSSCVRVCVSFLLFLYATSSSLLSLLAHTHAHGHEARHALLLPASECPCVGELQRPKK